MSTQSFNANFETVLCHLATRIELNPAVEKLSVKMDTRNDFKSWLTQKPYDLHSFFIYYAVGNTKDYNNVQNYSCSFASIALGEKNVQNSGHT